MSWNGPRSVVVEPSLLPTAETPRMTQPVAMTTATDSNGTLAIATINADAAGDDRETPSTTST